MGLFSFVLPVMVGVFIVGVVVMVITKLITGTVNQKEIEYRYRKTPALFSRAERSFLGVLNQCVGDQIEIFGKVRVADIINPEQGMTKSDWHKAFNKISGKHFDYVLCDKTKLSVVCVIELNDSSHKTKRRYDRDVFLEKACRSANLPLVWITARATYKADDIRQKLSRFIL